VKNKINEFALFKPDCIYWCIDYMGSRFGQGTHMHAVPHRRQKAVWIVSYAYAGYIAS